MTTSDSAYDLRCELANESEAPTWKPEVGEILVGVIQKMYRKLHVSKFGGGRYHVLRAVVKDEETGLDVEVWFLDVVLVDEASDWSPCVGERIGIKRLEDGGGGRYHRFTFKVDRTEVGPPATECPPANYGPEEIPA